MPFVIMRNDIANVAADTIVNTATPRPAIGAGTGVVYDTVSNAICRTRLPKKLLDILQRFDVACNRR